MAWLKWLWEKFNQSIQLKLTFYLIFILLPLIFFSLYTNVRSQRILESELSERTMSAMNSVLDYIDLTLDSLYSLSRLISTDVNLASRLQHSQDTLSLEAIIDFTHVLAQITNIRTVNPFLTEVTIYHENSNMMISSKVGALHREQAQAEPWYSEVVQANGANILYLPDRQVDALSGWADPVYNLDQIVLMRLMDLYSRDRGNNVLMLSIPKNKLLSYLVNLVPSGNSQVYLFDHADRLIVTNVPEANRIAMADIPQLGMSMQVTQENSTKNMVLRAKSSLSGWSLLLVEPVSEIYKKSKPLQIFSYWIILISCLLAVWIAWLVYSNISAPITSLVSGLRQLRLGNLSTRITNKRKDELGYLTEAFNQTIEQQQHLIRDIYEQQLRLTKTELKFLQSQINPHFLYNTLDSIYWSAKNYEAEEISEMVLNLSRFFRLSLSKGRETFTIEETFAHLQYYIRVQQIRFVDQFTVDFYCSDESRELYVLKLILQPLVENAILHGLESKKVGGKLIVTADVHKDRLLLKVSDNGRGIGKEEMSRIRQKFEEIDGHYAYRDKEQFGEYFGLLNVKARIKLYYGDTAEFFIESEEGQGTTATISLPRERCMNQQEGKQEHESHDH